MNKDEKAWTAMMIPTSELECDGFARYAVKRMIEKLALGFLDKLSDGKEYAVKMVSPQTIPNIERGMAEIRMGINIREIVRCKNCAHRDPETKKCDCGGHEMILGTFLPMPDDYFCADGERR